MTWYKLPFVFVQFISLCNSSNDVTQVDLQNWIPAFNLMDSILSSAVNKIECVCLPLTGCPDSDIEKEDDCHGEALEIEINRIKVILRFTSNVLKNSVNKDMYSSLEV